MRTKTLIPALGLLAFSLFAQQGHPLSGTWTGDWGAAGAPRTQVTFVMNWDGKKVSGIINPGPDAIPLSNVALDVTDWNIRLEADSKDGHIAAEGKLEDIGSYHRTIKGVWHQGAKTGEFKLTRD